ncbi:site-specific integrase [Treponema primitia]|uniref:site-specific integrase n=1 Tax=Treponema primitia TaxID=88058 RepID=UPI003981004D
MREQQLFSGEWGLIDRLGSKTALYSYIEKMSEGRDKQKDRVCKVLPWLKKYPGGLAIQVGQVQAKWFTNFQDYLLKDCGLSEQSAFSYAYAVRMALKQAVRENILPSDPSEGVKSISIPEPDREYLELEEIQQLSKVPLGGKLGAEVKRAFLFACYCALRVSDLKSLQWGDIQHNTSGVQVVKKQVKTRKRVVVPLHDSAWSIINDNVPHNPTDPVFPLLVKSKTDTNKYLIQWVEKTGIPKHITWHAARRTCPSLLHEMGVDIYTIQKICGHAQVKTTAIYTQVSDKSLRKAVDTLPSIEIK